MFPEASEEGAEASVCSFLSHTMVKKTSKRIIIVYLRPGYREAPGPGPSRLPTGLTQLARVDALGIGGSSSGGFSFAVGATRNMAPGL